MTHASSVQPPRVAVWVLDVFTPYEQTESIPGDLLEEFSDVASKSGVAYARRWYWRQSVRTIFHLIRGGFRVAPWSIAGVVLGGVLLVQLGHALAEWAIRTGIEKFVNHRVLPFHLLSRPALLTLLVNIGMYLCRLTVAMLIGCIIAIACKSREMLATITVSLVCSIQAVTGFWTFLHGWPDLPLKALPPVLLYSFGGLFAMVIGGGIVRKYRFRSLQIVRHNKT
jgi:hypothetical protein